MNPFIPHAASDCRIKVPQITLAFWIAYILTRPLGAALGDLLTQAPSYGGAGLGAMWTSALFLSVIVALVAAEQYLSVAHGPARVAR